MYQRKKNILNIISKTFWPILIVVSLFAFIQSRSWQVVIITVISWFVLHQLTMFLVKRRFVKKIQASGIHDVDQMDGFQFEYYLSALYKGLGFRTKITPDRGDFGADLIIKKDGEKRVIQAKRYGYNNRVGIDAVQQIYAAQAYYKAHSASVITNSYYTKAAHELAKACDVTLIDRNQLISKMEEMNAMANVHPIHIRSSIAPQKPCPVCESELVIREGNNGQFIGCSSFPQCKHTENI